MVHRHHQHLLLLCQTEQAPAHQRPARQIKWPARFLGDEALDLSASLLRRLRAQIGYGQRARLERRNDLHRFALRRRKGGAQYFMPADNLIEGSLQNRRINLAPEFQGDRHIIRIGARLQLVDEP